MKAKLLSKQLVLVTYLTLFMGIVSYGFTAVAARDLSTQSAARLLVIWTLLNILLLIFQFPIESFAPRLEIEISEVKLTRESAEVFIASYCLITAGLTALVVSAVYMTKYSDQVTEVIAIGLLILSMSLFFISRAIYIGKGDLKSAVRLVGLLALITIVSLLIYRFCNIKSIEGLVSTFTVSYLLAAILDAYLNKQSWVKKFRPNRIRSSLRQGTGYFVELNALMFTNAISLLLLTGGVTLGAFVGVENEAMISYIGLISLAMVPFSVLNSATLAILLSNIEHVRNRQYLLFIRLFRRSALVYLGLILVFSIGAVVFSQKALEIFLGQKYDINRAQSFWIFTSVGLAVLSALPRFLLTSLGVLKKSTRALILTVITYVSVLVLVRKGVDGLNAASIIASLLLFILSSSVLLRESKVLILGQDNRQV
jgi:hypothetical protein